MLNLVDYVEKWLNPLSLHLATDPLSASRPYTRWWRSGETETN